MQKNYYTISVRRLIIWRRFKVTNHAWENGRLIFDLHKGGQLQIPSNRVLSLKVFPDFWDYRSAVQALQEQKKLIEIQKHDQELQIRAEVERKLEIERRAQAPMPQVQQAVSTQGYGAVGSMGAGNSLGRAISGEEGQKELNFDNEEEVQAAFPHAKGEALRGALERVNGILPAGSLAAR